MEDIEGIGSKYMLKSSKCLIFEAVDVKHKRSGAAEQKLTNKKGAIGHSCKN